MTLAVHQDEQLLWWAEPADPGLWRYVPRHPSVERGPDGTPTAVVLGSAPNAHLQLGARLDPAPAVLEALRARLLAEHPEQAATLRLAPGVRGVVSVALFRDGADEEGEQVAEQPGALLYPPFNIVLRVGLDAAAEAAARAALAGETGRLTIAYGVVFVTEDVTALTADVGSWFASPDQKGSDAEDQ